MSYMPSLTQRTNDSNTRTVCEPVRARVKYVYTQETCIIFII